MVEYFYNLISQNNNLLIKNEIISDDSLSDRVISERSFINCSFSNISFHYLIFNQCNFENCEFKKILLYKCEFWNSNFKNLNLLSIIVFNSKIVLSTKIIDINDTDDFFNFYELIKNTRNLYGSYNALTRLWISLTAFFYTYILFYIIKVIFTNV